MGGPCKGIEGISGKIIWAYFGLFGAPLALLVALVVTKWWGKVVALSCLSLSQIGFIQSSERAMLIYLPDLDFKMSMLGRSIFQEIRAEVAG